jgi:hypothetical protein
MDSPASLTAIMWNAIHQQLSTLNKETFLQKAASADIPLLITKEGLTLSEIYLYLCMTSKPNRTKLEKS